MSVNTLSRSMSMWLSWWGRITTTGCVQETPPGYRRAPALWGQPGFRDRFCGESQPSEVFSWVRTQSLQQHGTQ